MFLQRILLGLAAVLAALPGLAATVAERSPFAQGTWWDPTRSGNGFEIFNAAGTVMVTWYTFDEAGSPIWYTAQGDVASLGNESWPLLQHRWANGRKAGYATVGSLRMTLRNPEGADIAWQLRGNTGSWSIQPFALSGIVNEVDHSGTWFDPLNSGWGVTLTEQGEITGGGLFAYDTQGEPTWLAGFERAQGIVELFAVSGSCPYCAFRASTSASAGRLGFEYRAETSLALHSNLTRSFAAGINVDGASLVQLGRPASQRAADRQLASFDGDASLRAYLDAGMLNVSPQSAPVDFSPAPAADATAFSTTNLMESGVDEADVVKSDGHAIYTFFHGASGVRQPVVRMAQVAADGSSLSPAGSYALASGPSTPMANAGLYLDGNQLVSVAGTQAISNVTPWVISGAWIQGKTYVEVMDVSDAGQIATRWRAELDGHILSSRRIGKRLYVVSRYVPYLQGFAYGANYPPAVAANQQTLGITTLAGLLPKIRIDDGAAAPVVGATAIHVPPQGTRRPVADMILIVAIDLEQPRVAQSLAILGAADTVYVAADNLYVASSRYELRNTFGVLLPEPPYYVTDIHQVHLGTDAMTVVASGSTEGFLGTDPDKSALRLSEQQGRLRVVTSSTNMWGPISRNRLTILQDSTVSPGLLKTVSYLPNAQRTQSLGKPGELVYGTRFVGDRLYAVTFRMTDPLYVVDLANAADPMITGTLDVPGFSEYLHPMPGGLLLGFGKDATASGFYQGLQLSLYDVNDAGKPVELQRVVMGKRGSDSALLRSHHAFSALMRSDGSATFAFPAQIHDGAPTSPPSDATYYPWLESGLMRFELRPGAGGARLAQQPSLITQSASQGAMSYYDPATTNGRSILFSAGTVYVGNGQFWRQDNNGNAYGPY